MQSTPISQLQNMPLPPTLQPQQTRSTTGPLQIPSYDPNPPISPSGNGITCIPETIPGMPQMQQQMPQMQQQPMTLPTNMPQQQMTGFPTQGPMPGSNIPFPTQIQPSPHGGYPGSSFQQQPPINYSPYNMQQQQQQQQQMQMQMQRAVQGGGDFFGKLPSFGKDDVNELVVIVILFFLLNSSFTVRQLYQLLPSCVRAENSMRPNFFGLVVLGLVMAIVFVIIKKLLAMNN